ncbi:hypothetical protein R3W88_031760 [Solanum pinnatisectum]|uniref:Uncharacterized protein n=1 Tax=Solanum pinnatisectum TaxID=50273 RepID=A0AAV9LMW4_9SOLN|nr:hypothetical protein R3W88_031760 [Solanum pinnatisectum]
MLIKEFTFMIQNENAEEACNHIQLFISSSAPADLVMLYSSQDMAKKSIADKFIHKFINSFCTLTEDASDVCVLLISEFCELLKTAVGVDDELLFYGSSGIHSPYDHRYYTNTHNSVTTNLSGNQLRSNQTLEDSRCHAPSLHPGWKWHSRSIAGPKRTLGLTYLLSGRLKHKKENPNTR